ncbi:hypothetical protein [Helicobacter pylori]|uniref:hypothetical protein n=1 Tax=Helicobacter pylori TaxID=210 RepID=UPI001FCFEE6D|nr:hypothetical protein [Helicobacter pylori]UOS72491.1 hypothetical protein MPG49_01425 [Helicobacter pylori]
MRTKLSPNISLGSPIALAFGCFTLFPNTRYMPHATNHKNTTTTEKIKYSMQQTL